MSRNSRLSILFVADLNSYSKGYARLKCFQKMGARVQSMSHTPVLNDSTGTVPRSFAFRLGWKLGFEQDTENVNDWLLNTSPTKAPDIIWIEKGNMIRPRVLSQLREKYPRSLLVSYSEDDMNNPINRTKAYCDGLGHYNAVITTKSYNANPAELPKLGAAKVIVVDKAYDPDRHHPLMFDDDEAVRYGADVGFIGSFEQSRAEDLIYLAEKNIPVRVWGNGWESFKENVPGLTVERHALVNSGGDLFYTKGICATRINLCFLRKANRDLQTDRSIEIPACGGFMLAEYTDEHARLFDEDKEAVFFRNREELVEKIRYYLDHEEQRAAIAKAGRERCVRDGYANMDRVQYMLTRLFEECGHER
jgi:glycosyltransferase involved in cell wall biosynthesis